MTYNDNLKDTKLKTLVELYEFNVGGVITRYTTAKKADVTLNANVYKRAKIERGQFIFDDQFKSTTLEIKAPVDANVARYISNFPIIDVDITVIGLFVEDGFCKTLFTGKVISATIQNFVGILTVESSTELFRDPYPRLAATAHCNHRLFDPRCGLIEAEYETPIIIDAFFSSNGIIEASLLDSPVFPASCVPPASFLDDWYKGGYIKNSDKSDIRLITDYDKAANKITLQAPFTASVIVGSTMFAYPGDDHAPETCKNKFCNIEKFLGTPYIPESNPVIFDFTD